MPINYLTNEHYVIDYEGLYHELMERCFLKNVRLQSDYLKLWLSELKRNDEIEVEQFKDKDFRKRMLKENSEAPEKYMMEIKYKVGTINIFFRVSRLLEAMGDVPENMVQYIDSNEFTKDNRCIKWDRAKVMGAVKTSPIILAPMTIDEYVKFIVIDGNHRLTSWIDNKKENIPCCIMDGQALIDNNMFCSSFSKLMYIFQNEIVALATYAMRDNINEVVLMNRSYFKTRKMLYDV